MVGNHRFFGQIFLSFSHFSFCRGTNTFIEVSSLQLPLGRGVVEPSCYTEKIFNSRNVGLTCPFKDILFVTKGRIWTNEWTEGSGVVERELTRI